MLAVRTRFLALCAALLAAPVVGAEEYSFDVGQFEKKPFEINGYAELRAERFWLDRENALYQLNFFDSEQRTLLNRTTGAVELSGLYRAGIATVQATVHGEAMRDELGHEGEASLYEGFLTLEPATGTRVEAGKRVLRWGKGYAWNPAGFVERPKDPNDPELAREGFVLLAGSVTRSFAGPLKTVSITPLVVPTGDNLNEDFGTGDQANPATRLSLLAYDTDIDLLVLGSGARSARYGFDFARNITTNLEIHGEWARITDVSKPVMSAGGVATQQTGDVSSWLLGLRHLSARDSTTILEYYHNGAGYTERELRDYFTFVHDAYDQFLATGDSTLLARARSVQAGYQRPTPGRRYLYLRVSQKEPFDILYFTPALTVIGNLDDGSYSASPELAYTGVTNLDLRLRLFFLSGGRLTDFGEKQNDRRLEMRARYYF
jgi:hypothetical protein